MADSDYTRRAISTNGANDRMSPKMTESVFFVPKISMTNMF